MAASRRRPTCCGRSADLFSTKIGTLPPAQAAELRREIDALTTTADEADAVPGLNPPHVAQALAGQLRPGSPLQQFLTDAAQHGGFTIERI